MIEIRPELQSLDVDDTIVLHGRSGYGPEVVPWTPSAPWCSAGCQTRRDRRRQPGRHVAGKGLAEKLGFGPALMDPIGFVMSKRMLQNLKKLAEASSA